MSLLLPVALRGVLRTASAGRHDSPLKTKGNGVDTDGGGHACTLDPAAVTPDEPLMFLPHAMHGRRMSAQFDRERILVDNADALLDNVEQAGVQLPPDAGEALLDVLQQHFADPSDALMALRTLRKRFLLAGHEAAFERAEQQLAGRVPRRTLLSGANAALSARSHASASGLHAAELRALYRGFVEQCPDALDTYSDWIETFDAAHRTVLVAFVRDALVADMDASDPSCTQAEFAPLAQALHTLVRLRSADRAFVARLRAAAGQAGWLHGTDCTPGEVDFDTPFVRILMDGVSGASSARECVDWLISAGCGGAPERARAVMVQALVAGFRLACESLYRDPATREVLLDGLQDELATLMAGERVADMRASLRRRR